MAPGAGSDRGDRAPRVPVDANTSPAQSSIASPDKQKHTPNSRRKASVVEEDPSKRRCVSTACVACRKRKSKCDGNLPACAACSQVYGTECIYDPNSDHRRKGVYKNDIDNLKTRNSTLHTLIQAILNTDEEDAFDLVRELRACESLDAVAEKIVAKENGFIIKGADADDGPSPAISDATFEAQLYSRMGDLRLDDGSVRYIGGTSNLIPISNDGEGDEADQFEQQDDPVTSWTTVTNDADLVLHLLNMYFTWHYTYFTTLSKTLFYRDFLLGKPPPHNRRRTHYCTPLLVNVILALGCHFTSRAGAREDPEDSATAGDHFFKEAKRLIMDNDELEKPRLTTVQALALMSVREAGCGRDSNGWLYSGVSFRMACDMGLNLNIGQLTSDRNVKGNEAEEDVRRVTFWGCYLFDKCWSNYLGRLPQLPTSIVTVPKYDVFPDEDSSQWCPYNDSGSSQAHAQPARTRTVALQISKLCEISNDLMHNFYNPSDIGKSRPKSVELKKLSEVHRKLVVWRADLPKELEPREGALSSVLTMHMFFQLLFLHLFRPFLRYTQATSPLPQNVSPRKLCTQASQMISKLMRLYKRSYGLRQICNITVYILHTACSIHLLNLPEKAAQRDILHGVRALEEIGESWLCARKSLGILSIMSRKWGIVLPDEASAVLSRTDKKFGNYTGPIQSPPPRQSRPEPADSSTTFAPQQAWQHPVTATSTQSYNGPASRPQALDFAGISSNTIAQQLGATIMPEDSTHRLPPHSAHDLQAQSYPSAQTSPLTQQLMQSRATSSNSLDASSDMFGGVEQLLRDSNEWTQYATGFDNWTGMEMGPASFPTPVAGASEMNDLSLRTPISTTSVTVPNGQVAGFGVNGQNASAHHSATSWPDDAANGYNEMAMYNEHEWYQ